MDHMLIKMVPLEWLEPHPDNPRKDLGDLTELADSIRANGIMQNLTVVSSPNDGMFRVVIGHRRMAAARLAGLKEVPCVLSQMDEKEQLATMLAENMQRSDLTPYEQAWGFQQMSLLGCSVEEISEKSGFSPATVRRRLKMAELDADKLKEVTAERQISLGDFDRLAEIEDIDLRNQALESIGTNNFEWKLSQMKREVQARKRYPAALEWLKAHGAKEIMQADADGRKYERLSLKNGGYWGVVYLDGKDAPEFPKDKEVKGVEIFYVPGKTSIGLYMYNTNIDASTGKKSREVLDREKLARDTKKEIKRIAAEHYELRKQFVERINIIKSDRERVLLGGVYVALYRSVFGASGSYKDVCEAIGVRPYEYQSRPIIQGIGKITLPTETKKLLGAVYAMYADRPEECFGQYMDVAGELPRFGDNVKLRLLYEWLISLGYEPCDEEQQMMDGTHAVYHGGKNV